MTTPNYNLLVSGFCFSVTSCGLGQEALNKLRERKDGYDLVIIDIKLPDMDGLQLLADIRLEMDLPVLKTCAVMSGDGEASRVLKGIQNGACHYLIKPVREEDMKIIWQHVAKKKISEVRDEQKPSGSNQNVKKRKVNGKNHEVNDSRPDSSSAKKLRISWTEDLHQKFLRAVHQIGIDKAVPKKILTLMDVPGLSRGKVASHLQKYRLSLQKVQKERELESCFGGMARAGLSSQDQQTSVSMPQNYSTGGRKLMVAPGSEIGGANALVPMQPETNHAVFPSSIQPLSWNWPQACQAPFQEEIFSNLSPLPGSWQWHQAPYINYDRKCSTSNGSPAATFHPGFAYTSDLEAMCLGGESDVPFLKEEIQWILGDENPQLTADALNDYQSLDCDYLYGLIHPDNC
ncbi:SANT/Myb domain [Dillenia turbinata]|uniref:SANT/Myb domain n=1 Tax=Dillenia turbinata TaxID=194707 RepID=A0AAN8VNF1_9MAGN